MLYVRVSYTTTPIAPPIVPSDITALNSAFRSGHGDELTQKSEEHTAGRETGSSIEAATSFEHPQPLPLMETAEPEQLPEIQQSTLSSELSQRTANSVGVKKGSTSSGRSGKTRKHRSHQGKFFALAEKHVDLSKVESRVSRGVGFLLKAAKWVNREIEAEAEEEAQGIVANSLAWVPGAWSRPVETAELVAATEE